MSVIIHSADKRTTINWASGTSTGIFIYPADGSFVDRNFLFRISTATVDAEASTFTFFEGITRHLMILKGELELIHEGRYTRHLRQYDQDTFSGEWNTRSKGKVTDFNLMLKDGATGSLTHASNNPGEVAIFEMDADFHFVYIANGSFESGDGIIIRPGDLVQLSKDSKLQLKGGGDLVEIRVMLK
jgi:environmental stress-induced protein Ves